VPVFLAPFVFPKLSPILVPFGVVILIALVLIGPKRNRKWKFRTPRRSTEIFDHSPTEIVDLDPSNPFSMYDDYYR
jgi:hypothetical protein